MRILKALAAAAMVVAAPVMAATTPTATASFGPASTNWTNALVLPKFDTSLGTLQAINISLGGTVLGTIRIESLDASPATVNSSLAATLTLSSINGSIVTTLPTASFSDNLSIFDGVIDFGGTSGVTRNGISASASNSAVLTSAPNLALFSGSAGDTINLSLSAFGASTANGAGNLIASFTTQAAGTASINYTYQANAGPVPEPAMLGLLGLGLVGIGAARRRRTA